MTHPRRIITLGLRSTILLTMLLGILAAAGPASAQETIIERHSYAIAMAEGQVCGDVCSDISFDIGPGKFYESTIVCLGLTTTVDGVVTSESGCADVAATFTVDSEQLTWAELAPTAVELWASVCAPDTKTCQEMPTRTVTLSATWTGTGELDRHQDHMGNPAGPCTSYDISHSLFRFSSVGVTVNEATGTIGGNLQYHDVTRYIRTANCG